MTRARWLLVGLALAVLVLAALAGTAASAEAAVGIDPDAIVFTTQLHNVQCVVWCTAWVQVRFLGADRGGVLRGFGLRDGQTLRLTARVIGSRLVDLRRTR